MKITSNGIMDRLNIDRKITTNSELCQQNNYPNTLSCKTGRTKPQIWLHSLKKNVIILHFILIKF